MLFSRFLSRVAHCSKLISYNLYHAVWDLTFYSRVRDEYKGYGLRYILTIISIGFIPYLVFVSSTWISFERHFVAGYGDDSRIGYVMNQFPKIQYNGQSISVDNAPYTILNQKGQRVIVIDPADNLLSLEKKEIPVVLGKNGAYVYGSTYLGTYASMLGNQPKTIDKEYIYYHIGETLQGKNFAIKLILLTLLLVSWNIVILYLLFKKFIFILLLYLFINLFFKHRSMELMSRLVMFASAPSILLFSIISVVAVQYVWISDLFQLWGNFLVIISLTRLKNSKEPSIF